MGRDAGQEGAQAQLDELSTLAPVLHVRCECNGASWDRDFHAGAFVVGRHELLSLRFQSEDISQFHAQIELNAAKQQWTAKELGSSNGSTLNGKKLRSDRRTGLKVGDTLEFAGVGSIEVLKISKLDVKKDTIVEAMRRRCHAISDADRADVEARIVGELHSLGWEDLKGDWEDENCGAPNE